MRRALAVGSALVGAAALLSGCMPPSGKGLHRSQLDTYIGAAVGDPSTCVLLADGNTDEVVYRYGVDFNCARALPTCDAPGVMNARAALRYAKQPGGRMASCPIGPGGAGGTVGWAEGRVQSKTRKLVYSAVMVGQRALPGHEINARLFDAFQKAGV